MADSKLIGTLNLSLGNIEATVNKANQALGKLGKGINLDMSGISVQKIQADLNKITKSIDHYSKRIEDIGNKSKRVTANTSTIINKSAITQVEQMNTQLRTMSQYLDSVGKKVQFISGGGKGVAADSTIRDLQTVLDAIKKVNEESLKMQAGKQQTPASVRELVSLYNQLSTAESKYLAADSKGHTAEADIWGKRADAIRESIKQLEAANPALKENAQVMEAKRKAEEDAAIAMERHKMAIDKVTEAQAKQNSPAKQAADIYKELKTSIKDYNDAMKAGNTEGAQAFSDKIDSLRGRLEELKTTFSQMKPGDAGYSEMADNINRAETALAKFNQEATKGNTALSTMGATTSQVGDRMMNWLTRILVYRGLRKMWSEAKEFATDYYQTLNEIQVVTQKTDSQMQGTANTFKNLSNELRVPLTDIADAATIFYRQGLNDTQVAERLEAVTKFSKISGTEVEDAAQYFTAVLNSFDELEGNATRVSDVFTYIGDNAATSGQEIATAMQRAAATAQAAGMGFEFLSSAIATVSANTRQSAETIGTAFNSMMARLHSIRTTGYNQEDETKVNDVAKALKTVGIELMNSEGQWQDFDQILTTLSKKWTTLNDKQKSYIATTLAGVRAQNYFLSLMQDMSKGLENGSTMWELYNGAMEASGISDQKYETYLNGIAAAQDRLAASLENLYDTIGSGSFFTGLYNTLAGIVEGFNSVTQAVNGMNIAIPVMIAGIAAVGLAISKVVSAVKTAGSIMGALSVSSYPFIAIATAALLAVGAITGIVAATTNLQDGFDTHLGQAETKINDLKRAIDTAKTAQQEWTDKAADVQSLKEQYIDLTTKVNRTAEENKELENVIKRIIEECPDMASALESGASGFAYQQGVVDALNASIEKYLSLAKEVGKSAVLESGIKAAIDAQKEINKSEAVLSNRKRTIDYVNQYVDDAKAKGSGLSTRELVRAAIYSKINYSDEDPTTTNIGDYAREWGIDPGLFPGLNISGIVDQIVEAYFGQTANLRSNETKRTDLKQAVSKMADYFFDTTGLEGGILEEANRRKAEFIESMFDAAGNLTAESEGGLEAQLRELEGISAEMQTVQERINNDRDLIEKQKAVEEKRTAYDEARKAGKSAEEITKAAEEYNQAADEFNQAYKDMVDRTIVGERGKDVYKHIEADLRNAGTAAIEAADDLETAYDKLDEILEKRRAVNKARRDAFYQQRETLNTAAYDTEGNFDRGTLLSAMNRMQAESPEIYKAMLENADFASLHNALMTQSANVTNANLEAMFKDAVMGWHEAGRAAQDYGDDVEEAVGESTESVSAGLLKALETGGFEEAMTYLANVPEKLMQQWSEEHPDLISTLFGGEDGEFNIDDFQDQLASLVDGTAERFGTLAEAISATGNTTQQTVDAIDTFMDYIGDAKNIQDLSSAWDKLTESQQKALKSLGVDKKQFEGLKEGSKAIKDLQNNLRKLRVQNLEKMGKVVSGTSDAYESLVNGTKDYLKYLPTLNQQINKTKQMQDAYDTVIDKSKEGTDEYTEALNTLASATSLTAEQLQTSGGMEQALAQLQDQAEITWNSIAALADTLLSMSTLTFDPSMIVGGYISLGAGADAAASQVANLVNEALKLLGASISFVSDGKGSGHFNVNGVKGSGSSSKKSGGGGGGGGGGGSKDSNTFSNRLKQLEQQMSRSVDKYKDLLERLDLYQSRFEDQNELTNVLRVLEQRRQVLIEQADAYNQILKDMPNLIQQAKNELSKYGSGTDEYTTALSDLQSLEDAYASYTAELIKNQTAQLQNADAIKETREAIVKLEGSLRNTIQAVIMERDEREANSLSARVDMENEILAAIQERYEKERKEIQETTSLRIKALDKETEALSDALDKRKELAEAEDKQAKLNELQAQYARIVADPTRVKEANEIAKKISDLQQEMAWDAAEREVEAQQKAIEQQQESLEDYQTFIDKYYDALIEDPRNFIDEYNELLSKSDAEIINWLSRNSDSYLKATDAAREQLVKGWQETMDSLRMYTRTVWDEVEAIMNLGDEGILNFLINNSQEFREANTFDQADMIYEWKEMLEDWHSAYKDTFQNLDYLEFTNSVYDWVISQIESAKSKGGGGGGGGGNTPSSIAQQYKIDPLKNATPVNADGTPAVSGSEAAQTTLTNMIMGILGNSVIPTWLVSAIGKGGKIFSAEVQASNENSAIEVFKKTKADNGPFSNIKASKKYAEGGLIDYTGTALVDGSKSRPERVLSAQQTKAFDSLVDWLTIPRINVPGLTQGMAPKYGQSSYGATFGDINIEVESLDSDADLGDLADRLMEAINERMLRGMAVGGGITSGY